MLFNKYFAIIALLAVQYSFQDSASSEDVSLSDESLLDLSNVEGTTLPSESQFEVTQTTKAGFMDRMKNSFEKTRMKAKNLFDNTKSKVKGLLRRFQRDLNDDYENIEKRSFLKDLAKNKLKKQAKKLGEKLMSKFF